MLNKTVTRVDIPGFKWISGKVRDWAVVDSSLGFMAVVATDRISAFDFVLPTPIPQKGIVLNQISNFWKKYLSDIVPNDIVSSDYLNVLPYLGLTSWSEEAELLNGRTVLVRVAEVVPVECIVRGYVSGSPLPQPIFTPTTKAAVGHDENLNYEQLLEHLKSRKRADALILAQLLKSTSLALYMTAFKYAWERGIIIADTKFEFGFVNGELTLIDEVLTPDSSRFWSKATYTRWKRQKSFDKQLVRDWLVSSGWNKQPPAPKLPGKIVNLTVKRYQEVARMLMKGVN